MRPTLKYIEEKFDHYNSLCFNGSLVRPPIRLNTRRTAMGLTRGLQKMDDNGTTYWTDLSIEISVRQDLSEEEYIDTLVHEMIHYYLMSNNIIDDAPHGTHFIKQMNRIKKDYGIKVTIAFTPEEETLIATIDRVRYICVIEDESGNMGVAVVARGKVWEVWDAMTRTNQKTTWYISNRSIFAQFPTAVSPRFIQIDAGRLQHYLTGAHQLTRNGNRIEIATS